MCKVFDVTGNELSVGSPVAVLTAGNFIYGHIKSINENNVEVIPDIGYRTSKPNFRLKKLYKTTVCHVALLDENKLNEKNESKI